MEAGAPTRRCCDPFAPTANPAAYVPRTATEAVIVRLEGALRDGETVLSLSGPAGAGKTLLLHVLADRLDGDFHSIYMPYPKLSAPEFCQWALAALNEPEGCDPELTLSSRLARDAATGFPPLLLMVDDAELMPSDTLRLLARVQRAARGFVRILLVRGDDAPPSVFTRTGLLIEEVELEGSMDPKEMARYVHARLRRVPADAQSQQRLEASLHRLHAMTDGNPARLHVAASQLLGFRERFGDTRWNPEATYGPQI
jgi:ABC-type multidrug transport system ATPase subunit